MSMTAHTPDTCPFCGNHPMASFAGAPDGTGHYHIHCNHDDCPAWPGTQAETEEGAIAAWNTRAASEMLAACQAALNYIANTESELGITLDSGDRLRAAIAKATGGAA